MSTETVGLLGAGAQDGHLDFHTAPELWETSFVLVYVRRSNICGLLGTGNGQKRLLAALSATVTGRW